MWFNEDGALYSGHYVFIACEPASDRERLEQLGLVHDLRPAPDEYHRAPDIYLAHDGKWAHVIDGLWYLLWNSRRFGRRVEQIASEHDVFRCFLGDCDESYGYSYYRSGQLVRAVDVASPNFDDVVVQRDFGEPLPEERALGNLVGVHHPNLLGLARALGIDVDHRTLGVRRYLFADLEAFE